MDGLSESEAQEAQRALVDQAQRRAELRQACEAAVVQWQWAPENAGLQRPQPLYHQRYGLPLPKLLDEAPSTPRTEQQYGLDANGEIVVAREYVGADEFREELRVRRGDTVVGYRWIETAEAAGVNIARFRDGRMQSYVEIWPQMLTVTDMPHGSLIERYAWDGDRLTVIDVQTVIVFGAMPATPDVTQIRPSYDHAGRLIELREHSARGEKVLYRARDSAPSIAALHRPVEDRLVELLPALVGEHVNEPIYCLALHYQPEWPLPPNVAAGIERDRREWMQSIRDPETLWLTVWNPAEFSSYSGESLGGRPLTDVDAELAAALAEIPENSEESREHGRATLNRVARRLQKLDWQPIAPVTADFVVFAVDLELTHLEENLRYSVPAALRKRLAAQRLLG